MRRLILITMACFLVGCGGEWQLQVDPDGTSRVTYKRTGEQYVAAADTITKDHPLHEGCELVDDAQKRNTPGAWGDYMRWLKDQLKKAQLKAKAADGKSEADRVVEREKGEGF